MSQTIPGYAVNAVNLALRSARDHDYFEDFKEHDPEGYKILVKYDQLHMTGLRSKARMRPGLRILMGIG